MEMNQTKLQKDTIDTLLHIIGMQTAISNEDIKEEVELRVRVDFKEEKDYTTIIHYLATMIVTIVPFPDFDKASKAFKTCLAIKT